MSGGEALCLGENGREEEVCDSWKHARTHACICVDLRNPEFPFCLCYICGLYAREGYS